MACTLYLYHKDAGGKTTLAATSTPCGHGMTMRSFTNNYAGGIMTLVNNTYDCYSSTCGGALLVHRDSLREHDTGNYGTGFGYRGNVTRSVVPGKTVNTAYDITGNVVSRNDSQGHTVSVTPDAANNFAVPSQITTNSTFTETLTFNNWLGLMSDVAPSGASASTTYDYQGRPATSTSVHGAVTTFDYSQLSSRILRATTNNKWTKKYLDGLGRVVKVETGNVSQGVKSTVDTEYDSCACSPLGKVKRVYQPYTGTPTAWTEYTYDSLGRTRTIVHPAGTGTTVYTYAGNKTTVTDPAGKWKKYENDVFGNLVKVEEPGSGGSPSQVPITVYRTGVLTGGGLAADGATDTHYTLVVSPDFMYPGPAAKVVNSSGFPIPPWLSNGPNSKWIAPRQDPGTPNYNMAGNYTYRTTFDLTGMNPATAQLTGQWAADDSATMKLNGALVSTTMGFSSWTQFTIATGFVAGVNTLDFVVNNGDKTESPTGLRVEISGTVQTGGGGNLFTNYTYDALNRLVTVSMPRGSVTQTRTWTYNATTQRLDSVSNPESGTVSYLYYSDGTLQRKTDAKGQWIQFTYDAHQRVTQAARYAGGVAQPCQQVDYSYDTNPYDGSFTQYGTSRLTAARWGSTCGNGYTWTEMYSYTQGGLATKKRLSPGGPFGTKALDAVYTYDNEGKRLTVKYPDTDNGSGGTVTGPTFTTTYDPMGRPDGMTDQTAQTWVQNVSYNAASQMLGMQYQSSPGLFWTESRAYNARLQMTQLTVTDAYSATQVNLAYNYSPAANNGRIASMTDAIANHTVSYEYDELNRLKKAETPAGAPNEWGNSYTFDGFGNLTAKTVTRGSAPSLSINVDGATNRIATAGYSYDLNGNMTAVPGVTGMAYDVDNRLTTANGEQYGYAPSNQRIWLRKSGGTEYFYFYGVDGARLGVYTRGTYNPPLSGPYFALVKQEVHFAGRRIRNGADAVAADRLGSTRKEGSTASRFFPYGEETTPTTAEDRQKFGTYYRDGGTGLDYANQRYYSSSIGRFLTADPYQASGGPADPGSWNRYAYVGGDPTNWRDSSGLL